MNAQKAVKSRPEKLAIDGGVPARRRPDPPMFPGGNSIGVEEERVVLQVLREKRLFRYYGPASGPSNAAHLEFAFADRLGAKNAIAVSSGSAALLCALAAAGVGPGDEVIIPAYTWIACAYTVTNVGAIPILAEVDETLTVDPVDAERKISSRTRAIVAVHMRGAPARMDQLRDLASRYRLTLIEDVAQAVGGSFLGQPLGSIGEIGCFSFQFNKIITCGEGGMIVTSDENLHRRALMFHDPVSARSSEIPSDEVLVGMNFRMPEISAAIARVQLTKLDGLISAMRSRKRRIKTGIARGVAEVDGKFRVLTDEEGDTGIALVFFMPSPEAAAHVIKCLRAENIGASLMYLRDRLDYHVYAHWAPILDQRTWTAQGGPWRWAPPVEYSREMCPGTLELLSRAVHLDVNPLLSTDEIDETIIGVNKVLASTQRPEPLRN